MSRDEELKKEVHLRAGRMRKQEEEQATLLAQTRYLGTLGLLLTLPIVGGAYLGLWLDEGRPGYSSAGTVGCLLLGILLGCVNIYLYLKGKI